MILQVLLLATATVLCQCTTAYYKPYTYKESVPAYHYEAPLKYVVKEPAKPYSFSYEAPAIGGGSSRQETSDGNGRVVGSYSITDADGRARVVNYYADETGFHADVQTNEPGTANQSPADVSVKSFAAPPVFPQKVISAPKIVASPKYIAPSPIYNVASPKYIAPSSIYNVASPKYIASSPLYNVASPKYIASSSLYNVASPKYIASSPIYNVAATKYVAPKSFYTVASPVTTLTKRLVAPLTYKVVPTYDYHTDGYSPLSYDDYYSPYKYDYLK